MKQICIHLPTLGPERTIDLEVKVDGKTQYMHYRVEAVDWGSGGPSHTARIAHLQRFIHDYEAGWELVQIGTPDGPLVPVMFRQRGAG